ncbi:unnamed protein product [Polarella glacialis]|uniref:Subtilisin n=1 Tax=Polarella glacialis TaxID=89957 RepID=A0A813J0G0_POLGL|nr:unnamed protein product [Polarella glacialis]
MWLRLVAQSLMLFPAGSKTEEETLVGIVGCGILPQPSCGLALGFTKETKSNRVSSTHGQSRQQHSSPAGAEIQRAAQAGQGGEARGGLSDSLLVHSVMPRNAVGQC